MMFNFGIKSFKYTRPYQVVLTIKWWTGAIEKNVIMRSGAVFAQDPAKCPWEFVL